jgi:hypothetical protein
MLTAVVLPTTFVQKRATDALAPNVGDRAALLVATPTPTPVATPTASSLKWWHWAAVIGGGAILGAFLLPRRTMLAGTSMLTTIAQEARSPEEFARRAEAWNAAEAQPLSITRLVKAYRGASPGTTARLIREAREARLVKRERLWSGMSKGLR